MANSQILKYLIFSKTFAKAGIFLAWDHLIQIMSINPGDDVLVVQRTNILEFN